MPTSANAYERLPGTGYRRLIPGWAQVLLFFVIGIFVLLLRGRRVQLWLGSDHLLLVDWDGYREFYKRFRYADIQSIVVRQTSEQKIVLALLGGMLVLFGIFGVAADEVAVRIFFFIVAGLSGLFLVLNYLAGPMCTVELRTAVQTEGLYSLTRLRHARTALDRLRPLILAAQGPLTSEEIVAHMSGQAALTAAGMPDAAAPAAAPLLALPPLPPKHYQRPTHAILLFLLLLNLPMTLLNLLHDVGWTNACGMVLMVAAVAAAVTALVQQQHTDLPKFLRRIPVVVLVSTGVTVAFGVGYGFLKAINGGAAAAAAADFSAHLDDPVTLVITAATTMLNVVLGVLGSIHLRRFRAQFIPAVPPPITPPVNN